MKRIILSISIAISLFSKEYTLEELEKMDKYKAEYIITHSILVVDRYEQLIKNLDLEAEPEYYENKLFLLGKEKNSKKAEIIFSENIENTEKLCKLITHSSKFDIYKNPDLKFHSLRCFSPNDQFVLFPIIIKNINKTLYIGKFNDFKYRRLLYSVKYDFKDKL